MDRSRLNQVLGIAVFLAIVVLLTASGRAEEARMESQERARDAMAVEAGAALYAEHCSSCHGVSGHGVGQQGPPLNDLDFFQERLGEVGWQGSLVEYVESTVA
ncbi:MAG: c-type cytochrome, partial [Anaerolineae bacterium]